MDTIDDSRVTDLGPLGALTAGGSLSPEEATERGVAIAAVRRGLFGDSGELPRIGRFVVLRRIASGGMGVVYLARDEELDRKLALKVIRDDARVSADRLQREAKILAKLSHPNVVPVYEVGTHEGALFIAMEYIHGMTLRRWCDEEARGWSELLSVFRQAGEGLAAAHGAGLVHRDFKPDNALFGDDGRVRVVDFGLARLDGARSEAVVASARALLRADTRLTSTGAVLGTPAYMAPEQFLGAAVDARTDQFAFCVSLWEALHRQRPFSEGSIERLVDAVIAGHLRPPPPGTKVPRWIRDALARGLQPDPAARHPSMRALLDALANDPRRRRVIVAAMAVAGSAGLATLGASAWADHRDRQELEQRTIACTQEAARIDEVWSAEPRQQLQGALVGSGVPYASATAEHVTQWLDRYADDWRSARDGACLDFEVRLAADADTHARAVACLDAREGELHALVTELSRTDARSVQRAVQAAARLERIASCTDAESLARQPAVPTASTDEVQEIRGELARIAVLRLTGQYDEGLVAARTTLLRAEALGWQPLVAAAGLSTGILLEADGAYVDAESTLSAAYFAAFKAGATDVAIDAANQLTFTVGNRLARTDDGLLWSQLGDALLGPASDPSGMKTADHLEKTALVHALAGARARAAELLERALELSEHTLGPEHPDLVIKLANLGGVYLDAGEGERARSHYERALVLAEQAFGAEHPLVGGVLHGLGNTSLRLGEHDRARGYYERALDLRERALGPQHPDVAGTLNNLGQLHFQLHEYAAAAADYRRALTIAEHVYGPDHPEVAGTLANLGDLYQATGDHAAALAAQTRALAIVEQAFGPAHPRVAAIVNNLANTHAEMGEHEQARALYERALELREQAFGPDHPEVAQTLQNFAKSRRAAGDDARADELERRAAAIGAVPP